MRPLSADLEVAYEDVPERFELPMGSQVPAGRYTFVRVDGGIESPPCALLRVELDWSLGTFYDGWRSSIAADGRWNAWRHLEVAAEYALDAPDPTGEIFPRVRLVSTAGGRHGAPGRSPLVMKRQGSGGAK